MGVNQVVLEVQKHQTREDHLVDVLVCSLVAKNRLCPNPIGLELFKKLVHLVKIVDDLKVCDDLESIGLEFTMKTGTGRLIFLAKLQSRYSFRLHLLVCAELWLCQWPTRIWPCHFDSICCCCLQDRRLMIAIIASCLRAAKFCSLGSRIACWHIALCLTFAFKMGKARLEEARVAIGFLQRFRICLKCKYGCACQARVIHDRHELVFRQDTPDLVILNQNNIEGMFVHLEGIAYEVFQMVDGLVRFD